MEVQQNVVSLQLVNCNEKVYIRAAYYYEVRKREEKKKMFF